MRFLKCCNEESTISYVTFLLLKCWTWIQSWDNVQRNPECWIFNMTTTWALQKCQWLEMPNKKVCGWSERQLKRRLWNWERIMTWRVGGCSPSWISCSSRVTRAGREQSRHVTAEISEEPVDSEWIEASSYPHQRDSEFLIIYQNSIFSTWAGKGSHPEKACLFTIEH